MCGIVAAIAERKVGQILIAGLKALEYRGYDSAGLAILEQDQLKSIKQVGKVKALELAFDENPIMGNIGIGHTRWATHGKPTQINAHPHRSEHIAVVHNGIIEHDKKYRGLLEEAGYEFESDTDSEVIAHYLHQKMASGLSLFESMALLEQNLNGAFAIAAISDKEPESLIACRKGAPMVIGLGIGENFIASDTQALLPVTNHFQFLEDGDVVQVKRNAIQIKQKDQILERETHIVDIQQESLDKGPYRHYMLKEIHEQPTVIADTLEGRIVNQDIIEGLLGPDEKHLTKIKQVHIVACGTSYHAGLIARKWIEKFAKTAVQVEVASEFLYQNNVVPPDTLFVCISQSGETADTLSALRKAKKLNYQSEIAICNVAQSTLVREAPICLLTRAGTEIGVASTKAFSTQLTALAMLALKLETLIQGKSEQYRERVEALRTVSADVERALLQEKNIEKMAQDFADKQHAIFLGRGSQFPVAMEGALKLKEISYIHAEAYPAGELKHGPLALIDEDMPVIAVAPNDELLEKLRSNMQEVKARGGQLYVIADEAIAQEIDHHYAIGIPVNSQWLSAIAFSIPLQLFSYYVALLKGTDIDQPRNLAKSVTVE